MKRISLATAVIVVLTAALCIMLTHCPAHAGTVTIHDEAGVLDPEAQQHILDQTERWPFHLRILTSLVRTKAELQGVVRLGAESPGVVCIGLQPEMRFVNVQWGRGLRVRAGDWPTVYAAGNKEFAHGNWAAGIVKVADAATSKGRWTREELAEMGVEPPPAPLEGDTVSALQWLFLAVLLVAFVYGLYWLFRPKYGPANGGGYYAGSSVLVVNSYGSDSSSSDSSRDLDGGGSSDS